VEAQAMSVLLGSNFKSSGQIVVVVLFVHGTPALFLIAIVIRFVMAFKKVKK
jgi:hypothetical protein